MWQTYHTLSSEEPYPLFLNSKEGSTKHHIKCIYKHVLTVDIKVNVTELEDDGFLPSFWSCSLEILLFQW